MEKKINFWGKVSISLLFLVVAAMSFPINQPTHAQTSDNPEDVLATENVNTETRIWVKPVVSVAISEKVDIEAVPKSTGNFNKGVADLNIATNSRDGLKVLLNTVDGTALKPTSGTGTKEINTITAKTTMENFTPNTWGYHIGNDIATDTDQYSPLSNTSTEVLSTSTSSTQQSYKITFGTMIDTSLPAGLYKGSIMLSVVVNPIQAVSINDLYYMQDIKPEICAASKIWSNDSDSKILIDYRDGKKYKVAKLKDGNCWMQQNLTLGLSKSTPLTSADSDVTTTWTPPSDITSADNMTYSAGIALAGSQTSATANGAEYSSSICPKGWKLPLGGNSNGNISGSLHNLVVNMYNMPTRPNANAPLYLSGSYDYASRTAKGSSSMYTDRIFVPSYTVWFSDEPFTDPVAIRCVAAQQ